MKKKIKGYSNIVKGNSKKLAGKVVGNKGMEVKGLAQKEMGKAQVAVGNVESNIKKIKQ